VSTSKSRWLRDVTSLAAFKGSNMKTEIIAVSEVLSVPGNSCACDRVISGVGRELLFSWFYTRGRPQVLPPEKASGSHEQEQSSSDE
jgi:hypothetical protein